MAPKKPAQASEKKDDLLTIISRITLVVIFGFLLLGAPVTVPVATAVATSGYEEGVFGNDSSGR